MKILVLGGLTRHAGGLFYAVRSLCHALHKKGCKLFVLGCSNIDDNNDILTWKPVSAKSYNSFGPLNFSFELRSILGEVSAELIHIHGIWSYDQLASLQWQKRNHKPVIISPHGMLDSWALKNSSWKKKLVRKFFADESLRSATCLHALCESEVDSIRAFGLKNPIAIIPNGINLPSVKSQIEDINSQIVFNPVETKQKIRKRILFLGRIHPKKGLKELIDAWRILSMESLNMISWELIIAGWDDGGHEASLKHQAKSLGLDNSISFVGPMFGDEKDHLLRAADAFILPSFSEGLPMSILEAWSYQLPVLMTDFCNIPEGFETGSAIHIEPTPKSIAIGLQTMMNMQPDVLMEIGYKGRTLVENKFTWESIAEQMKDVYAWCVTGENPPACLRFD